jgi:hypothetical protein
LVPWYIGITSVCLTEKTSSSLVGIVKMVTAIKYYGKLTKIPSCKMPAKLI